MNETESYIITNCRLPGESDIRHKKTITVIEGKIVRISAAPEIGQAGRKLPVFDAGGNLAVPGFVELHIHGCGDVSLEQDGGGEENNLHKMCLVLEEKGINTVVPTMQCSEPVLAMLGRELEGSSRLQRHIPGLYVEGPFVHPDKRGGILESHIEAPDTDRLKRLQETARGTIKIMTIAPELPGMDKIIKVMDDLKIIPAFGHSTADAASALVLAEAREGRAPLHITHLFNAMSGLSHKNPGLAALPFLTENLTFEVNGDGIHVHPDMLNVCWRHLNRSEMVLISDAVVSAGLGPGEFRYFDKPVVSGPEGVRYKDNGVLIGSPYLVPQSALNFAETVGADLEEVLPLFTDNPRRLLGGGRERKSGGGEDESAGNGIEEGCEADLLIVDDKLQVMINLSGYSGHMPDAGIY